jgi:hypothetical protein
MSRPTFVSLVRGLPLVIGILAVIMVGCGQGQGGDDVTVVQPRLVQTPGGQRAFTGVLVNRRPQALSIAQVEVALYDASGSPVETIRIDVRDVPAQDSVEFSGVIDSDRPFRQAQVQSVLTP